MPRMVEIGFEGGKEWSLPRVFHFGPGSQHEIITFGENDNFLRE